MAEHIGQRAGKHAHLPVERGHPSEMLHHSIEMLFRKRLRALFFYQMDDAVLGARSVRKRCEGCERF